MDIDIKQVVRRLNLQDITAQAERVSGVIQTVRHAMLAPTSKKEAPSLSAGELAELCDTTKAVVSYRANKGDLPEGTLEGNKKVWSMDEARQWARQLRASHMRPQGALGVTITLSNFKGGVSKTTTTVTLAQGLAMRGHRVLVVDLDPQGSTTTLFGISPNLDVEVEQTAAPLFDGSEASLDFAIQPTYWPGVDLVCAGPLLFNAEFQLPARQMRDPNFEFWRVLDRGLDQAREAYDIILIDTAPMLSYVVINALLAADAVVIPMPPATVDFASSEHFWQLFSDLCGQLISNRGQDKTFEFMNVLLSRVESDSAATVVRQWILEAFGEKVLPVEVPKAAAIDTASAEFGTIYDLRRGSIASKTLDRVKPVFDNLCGVIEQQVETVWATQLEEFNSGATQSTLSGLDVDLKQAHKRQGLPDIMAQAERVAAVIQTVRHQMLAPTSQKTTPTLTAGEMAELCNTTKPALVYRATKGDLPEGAMIGNKRVWSVAEAQQWARQLRSAHLRPAGTLGVTITLANFKGGVSKTTTAVSLAQGLALRGHRVLVVDLDPQGSATTLFGISPNLDVEIENTAALLFEGSKTSIEYAIRPTYWAGVDLVCAGPLLFNAEFQLPSRQMKDPGFEFWRVLDRGLDQAREDYDVIIIDTAPMLSYVVINALLAADGVIIPMPPATMDFASSEHFWQLFSDLCNQLVANRGQDKTFEFVNVLLSRVEGKLSATTVVRQWILEAYGDKVLPVEIPKTSAASTASAEFGTVYDLHRGSIDSKTYNLAKTAYDGLCDAIEQQLEGVWANQLKELNIGATHVA